MADNKSFLLVDDDEDDRDFFREAVSEIYPAILVQEATDGVHALEVLHLTTLPLPDIIFLDLNMPRMNGKALLLELKNNRLFQHIPVFVFTTSSDPKDREDSLSLGATLFFTKPGDFGDLREYIRSVVDLVYFIPD
ncbi:response regulator [Algoriphagus sp. H41]|uniref:Response regulator n=1 Tax=Algoriphagus oliviformis TaxID=2811231 RepID=A0ABS3C3Z6_9BACT|nr:response regulator [Algoriphagus oliviformis]MBN7811821.1 response regulator [Algoriphagus oliviformis]